MLTMGLNNGAITIIMVFLVPIVSVSGWTIVGIAKQWRKARESEHDTVLKQDMIARGMSADDIERVLRASSRGEEPADSVRSQTTPPETK